MPAKVTSGDSLPIHEFTYSFSVTSNMTSYSHWYHSIKLIHCDAPQRDVLSDKMVLWVVTHIFYFMLCQSSLLSAVISFIQRQIVVWWKYVNCAAINLIQNHPPGTTLGTRLEGGKNPPPGTIIVYNTLPSGQNRESKAHPRDIKLENFTNVSKNSDTIWNEKLCGLNK